MIFNSLLRQLVRRRLDEPTVLTGQFDNIHPHDIEERFFAVT